MRLEEWRDIVRKGEWRCEAWKERESESTQESCERTNLAAKLKVRGLLGHVWSHGRELREHRCTSEPRVLEERQCRMHSCVLVA